MPSRPVPSDAGRRWLCVGQNGITNGRPSLAAVLTGARFDHWNREASGSTDRWFRPDAVRYASVTIATQGLTATHHDPQWDSSKLARLAVNIQLTGRFRSCGRRWARGNGN